MVLPREARPIVMAIGVGAIATVGVTRVFAELLMISATDRRMWVAVRVLCGGFGSGCGRARNLAAGSVGGAERGLADEQARRERRLLRRRPAVVFSLPGCIFPPGPPGERAACCG